MKQPKSFRAFTYLSLFALAITVPLLLLIGGLLVESASVQRQQLEGRLLQALDALVNDVDRDLDRDITILHTLATSEALARTDWPAFYNQAKAALQGRAYLVLTDSNGKQLVNTHVPYGEQPPLTGDPETVRKVVHAKAPLVSNVFKSLVVKRPVFNVDIPVLRDGQVRYVMSMGLLPDNLLELLKSQGLNSEWVTTIWDANGAILARSRDNARYVGNPLPRNMRERAERGVVRTTNLDGTDVLHATARSRVSGWAVGVNIPYSMYTSQLRHSLLLWGGVAVLAIAIALILGLFFARQITAPLSVASDAAAAFGRGQSFPVTGSRLKEADAFLETLKGAEQELRLALGRAQKGETLLHAIMDCVPEGITYAEAPDVTIRMVSRHGMELLGRPREMLEGRSVDEHARTWDIHRLDGTPAVNEELPLTRAVTRGEVILGEEWIIGDSAGRALFILCNAAPVRDADGKIFGGLVAWRDITERKLAQQELVRARDQLAEELSGTRELHELTGRLMSLSDLPSMLYEVLAAALAITRADKGNIQLVDSVGALRIEAHQGFSREFLDFFGTVKAGDDAACGAAYARGERIVIEDLEQAPHFSGTQASSVVLAEGVRAVQSTPIINRSGVLIGMLSTHYTSPHQPSERDLRLIDLLAREAADLIENLRAQDSLRRSNEALSRANEDLNQFAFAASHDLQEPLRMITNYSQLLLRGYRGQLEHEAETCIEFITQGTRRMRDLLADLLAYSQLTGEQPVPVSPVDLNEVFQTVLENCRTTIDDAGASVISDPLPTVLGRKPHFIQLFQNLISNALKYRGAPAPHIYISVARKSGMWRIGVNDNGIGIAPEYHKQIFGIFKRLHGRNISGTGIGLAICQRVVERYDGRIWVESKENEGSTFYFTLPSGTKEGAATA